MGRLGALALCVFLLAALSAGTTRAEPAAVACGRISVKLSGRLYTYSVRVVVGRLGCTTARSVLRSFLVTSRSPRGWFCVRGHASQGQTWAAGCVRSGADIRAYLVRR